MAIYRQDTFTGGIAEGSKRGYTGGFQDALGIDFMGDPDKLQVNSQLVKDSGTTVTDLVLWHDAFDGYDFFYGNTGKVYRRAPNGTYTLITTITDSVGNGMAIFYDELWLASNTQIIKITDITGVTPTVYTDYLKSLDTEVDQWNDTGWGGSTTYTLPTSIGEGATAKWTFTPTKDLITGFTFEVVAKGTGVLTLTLHDASNNVIATKTIANADLIQGVNRVTLDTARSVTIGSAYHIHLTISTGTTTVKTSTASDLATLGASQLTDQLDGDVDQSNPIATFSTNTATLAGSIIEAPAYMVEFTPTKEYLSGISILVGNYAASTWRITLHDAQNNEIAISDKASTTLKRKGVYVKFVFSPAVALTAGQTYHFHVTVSAGTNTVYTSTASDLSTMYYKTHASVLTNHALHPMKVYTNLLTIGNGNFLATMDDSEVFDPERLKFPYGENVRTLDTVGDYLAIPTVRGTSLDQYGEGRLYFWDSVAVTFNAFVQLDGQTNTIRNDSNKLMIIHGTQVQISQYTGAVTKVRQLKNLNKTISAEVLPGAIDRWEGVMYFGISNANSDLIDSCIYSYGRKDKDYPYALNKAFVISTGGKDSDVTIGMIKGISANKFYVAWQDDTNYGIDIIDHTKKQNDAYITFLRFDDNHPNNEKKIKTASLRYEPILAGQKITLQYRFDNNGAFEEWGTVDPDTNAADLNTYYKSFASAMVPNTAFYEVEFKIVIEGNETTDTAPTILSFELEFDRQSKQQNGRKS